MASVLKVLLCILLCKLRFTGTRRLILRCFKSWAQFLAFLGRRLRLGRWKNGKGTFHRAEKTAPGTGARLDVRQDNAVAFSSIPASARQSPLTISEAGATTPANLTAKPQHDHPQAYSPLAFDAGIHFNRSRASLSIHSRASDRLSIIQLHSHESLHPPLGQSKGNPRAPHRQFGCGPSTDHLEVPSHSHASPSPTGAHGHRRGQSSTSVVVAIENPSTPSLPRSHLVDSPLPEQSYSIGSSTVHSSPASNPPDLPEESPKLTPTAASSIFDFDLPDGRLLQLIVSEQVPRYTKNVTV
jgi:hypothetical protein